MKKLKFSNVSTLVSAIALFALLMAGCSSSNNEPASSTGAASTEPAASTSASASAVSSEDPLKEHVTLTWYIDGTPQKDINDVLVEANKILNEKINADLKLEYIDWSNYDQQMKLKVAAGEKFDLAFTSNWAFNFTQYATNGAFLALDDLLPKYGQNILNQVNPASIWDSTKIDGKIYAVPHFGSYVNGNGLLFNKDVLDQLGYDVSGIKKLSDLEPFLAQVKSSMPEIIPYAPSGTNGNLSIIEASVNDTYVPVDGSTYLFYDYKTGKVVNNLTMPEKVDAFKTLRDWYKKGYIQKDAASIKDMNTLLKTRKYAVQIGTYVLGEPSIDDSNASQGNGGPIKALKLYDNIMTPSSIQPKMTAISKTSEHPDRAMMLLNMINDPSDNKLFTLLAYGLEGKHYKVVGSDPGDGKPVIEPIAGSGYDAQLSWELGPDTTRPYTAGTGSKFLEIALKLNQTAKVSPLFGFNYKLDAVNNENAAVTAVIQKYNNILVTGAADVDSTISKMNDELSKAGIDKVIADAEKQINDWKSANGK